MNVKKRKSRRALFSPFSLSFYISQSVGRCRKTKDVDRRRVYIQEIDEKQSNKKGKARRHRDRDKPNKKLLKYYYL